MGKKRLAIAVVVVLLVVGTAAVLRNALVWPPPSRVNGEPPAIEIAGKPLRLVKVGPGAIRVLLENWEEGSWRVVPDSAEVSSAFWISNATVSAAACPPRDPRFEDLVKLALMDPALSPSRRSKASLPESFRMPFLQEWALALAVNAIEQEAEAEWVRDGNGELCWVSASEGKIRIHPQVPLLRARFRLVWIPPEGR